jgi:transcriptional regulator with XRE-family HTH domain
MVQSAASPARTKPARRAGKPLAEAEVAEVVNSIGPKIRELRDMLGLSLQQLSDRCDVSPAAIHKVEQGNMVPTITTLLKLAVALDRPVAYFVDEEEAPPATMVVTRAKERKNLYTSHTGITLEGISGPYGQYFVASAVADVIPGASSGEKPLRHPGEELIHVLAGTLEIEVDGHAVRLGVGDSVHFRTDRDHRWSNPSKRPARAVWMALRPA